jgi:hypothetical protein
LSDFSLGFCLDSVDPVKLQSVPKAQDHMVLDKYTEATYNEYLDQEVAKTV